MIVDFFFGNEIPLLLLLVRYVVRLAHFEFVKTLLVGLLATTFSSPLLWFILVPGLSVARYPMYLGEGIVFLVEARFYRMLLGASWRQALFLSLVTNAASYLVGMALF